jgi:polyhydroxyalkanoate synthesis regulator phasin
MKDTLNHFLNLGIGAVAMTADKAEKLVNELIEKGDIERKESHDLKERIIKRGEEARKELDKNVEKRVQQALKKLNIPTRKEFNDLKKKLKDLAK